MNRINEKTLRGDQPIPEFKHPRHPVTQDNPKDVMFERMATVRRRIAAFEEKLNASRKENTR